MCSSELPTTFFFLENLSRLKEIALLECRPSSNAISFSLVRFEVFMAVTEEWRTG
jgi:hypothetical protein